MTPPPETEAALPVLILLPLRLLQAWGVQQGSGTWFLFCASSLSVIAPACCCAAVTAATAACCFRHVLSDVGGPSLVLVDELGKGTEVRAGAALAGAMLEELARIGCKVRQRPLQGLWHAGMH